MTARIACCIPGCRRTIGKPYSEWICGKLWARVPREVRAVYLRARRKRSFATDMLWLRCKKIAIESNFMDFA